EEATVRAARLRQTIQDEHLAYVEALVARHTTEDGIVIDEINQLPTDLRRLALQVLLPDVRLTSEDFDRFLAWLRVDMPSSEVYYGNWRIRRAYGYLTCIEKDTTDSALESFQVGADLGTYRYGERDVTFSYGDAGIPLAEVTFPLTVRSQLPGDRIQLEIGTKKVSRILIDAKVPRYLRAEVPVVVDATGQVLAVVGHRIAKFGSFELLARSYLMIEW
ncbi:MAG: tRNA lysidine(34) synthetase TilS, partial [Exiguobacterium oxidotolerans]